MQLLNKIITFLKTHRLRLGWYTFQEYDEDTEEPACRVVLWRWVQREAPEEAWTPSVLPENANEYQKRQYVLDMATTHFAINSFLINQIEVEERQKEVELHEAVPIQVRRIPKR
jgi:hypothetical protein